MAESTLVNTGGETGIYSKRSVANTYEERPGNAQSTYNCQFICSTAIGEYSINKKYKDNNIV